ncbi:MAG TPA: TolC family protein [Thermoanaerobaculia bacterium]|nr:TolC family protein [Thermoanaerobaculia bacterium]
MASPQAPAEPSFGTTLELEELVAAVLARNAGLAAMAAAVRAARARVDQATALEDPIASATLAPLSLGGGTRLGYEVRASQRIPYPGKRKLRGEVAGDEATVAAEALQATRVELAARAVSLYADYYLNARELEVNAEHLALLGAFKEVATARYAAGLVPQQAPIQAEVEAARMLHHEIELRATGREIVAALDALLHRPAESPLPPTPATLPAGGPPVVEHGTPRLQEVTERPELRAQSAEVAARQGELELARRARQPDFEAMAGYSSMWDTPEHRVTVGVGVSLPIRRARIRAEVAGAQARLEQAEADLERLTDTFRAEAVSAVAHREEMAHLVELYRDRVLPAAHDQVAAARASFESGEESMLGLIAAERSLRDAQQQYHEAVAGFVRARAAEARSLGELPGQQNAAATPPPAER